MRACATHRRFCVSIRPLVVLGAVAQATGELIHSGFRPSRTSSIVAASQPMRIGCTQLGSLRSKQHHLLWTSPQPEPSGPLRWASNHALSLLNMHFLLQSLPTAHGAYLLGNCARLALFLQRSACSVGQVSAPSSYGRWHFVDWLKPGRYTIPAERTASSS